MTDIEKRILHKLWEAEQHHGLAALRRGIAEVANCFEYRAPHPRDEKYDDEAALIGATEDVALGVLKAIEVWLEGGCLDLSAAIKAAMLTDEMSARMGHKK